MVNTVEISKQVLDRLTTIGYEKESLVSSGQLIFPSKRNGRRISEQELRQLFIEEFKNKYTDLYFSIETPTVHSYSFTNELNEICVSEKGQSALIDMCILKKESKTSNYTRILNIEFKHKNATEANISKDILKLIHEDENGAFVLLLKNTDDGTLINKGVTGVLDKLYKSIKVHKSQWNNSNRTKFIELVILSLEEKKDGKPFIMSRTISGSNINTLDTSIDKWEKEVLDDGNYKIVDKL